MQNQKKQILYIVIAATVGFLFFLLSLIFFTLPQSLLLGVIALLVALWTNEALPVGIVSLLPIILFPSLSILSTKDTAINYANPIIYLFFGGFLIAIAVEKTQLHRYIAHKILKIFPSTPKGIIFSLTFTSGLLSAFLSNTATTLLLISIALFISQDIRLKMRFALSIAYGASVGGILTPIGTPPNLIFLGFMQDKGMQSIAFLEWVWMVAPVVFIMLFVVAILLGLGTKEINISFENDAKVLTKEQKRVLYLVGALLLVLCLNASLEPYWSGLGLNESAVLLCFGLVLFAPPLNILEWAEDKSKVPYEIMFLFGAGFSIASAFSSTGLADKIASYLLEMSGFSPFMLLVAVALLITFTTEITSNTALISIMLPVVYSVSTHMHQDATLFMMVATICASYAFMLPIATAPNAIAMSSGAISIKDMAKYGLVLNFVGVAVIVLAAEFFWK
ncbi:MAG: solute carrier family 13 (sodium-dependent dicarboxylate transporter), er 2/3/5 [Campylobacterota bacterium]|nr:solute carrier family 13 (sodium-dependent dicarboxylate transporter), er 2/3/5 [Campylobacterota bacterium]